AFPHLRRLAGRWQSGRISAILQRNWYTGPIAAAAGTNALSWFHRAVCTARIRPARSADYATSSGRTKMTDRAGSLRLDLYDAYGEPLNEKIDIFLYHQTLSETVPVRNVLASKPM